MPPPSKDRQSSSTKNNNRVIALLDLDAFYAQSECIRLGYDSTTTPLALLQWNSVLAVTYPARELYNVSRMDGWDSVRKKSNGKCLTVHVPILSHTTTTTNQQTRSSDDNNNTNSNNNSTDQQQDDSNITTTNNTSDNDNDSPFSLESMDEQYEKIFQATDIEKENARKELGVRRFSQQGKACIERYRIASRRIFGTILQYLETLNAQLEEQQQQHNNIIMERASIDELFLDVTGACSSDAIIKETDDDFQKALAATKILGDKEQQATGSSTNDDDGNNNNVNIDPSELLTLQRGVVLAYRIRKHVRDTLGFTMTAGIGQNKTIAKLSASYGKPNGQAVTYSHAVQHLLNETEIKKCRNFGGKLGKRIKALLPPNVPTTIGSITKYLSLPELEKGIGDVATARWVYQVARGIDMEAVVVREQALIKSITAFKSLPFNTEGSSILEAEPWIRLLAQEVVKRVEQDAGRNKRYPRSLNIHYAQPGWGHQKTVSIRIDFPSERLSSDDKINMLASNVPKLILNKAGKDFKIHRIGLCAENFLVKEKNGLAIDSYFTAKAAVGKSNHAAADSKPSGVGSLTSSNQALQGLNSTACGADTATEVSMAKTSTEKRQSDISAKPDRDLELALKLQAEYDREQRMLETLERRDKINTGKPQRPSKKLAAASQSKRIDSFFKKR